MSTGWHPSTVRIVAEVSKLTGVSPLIIKSHTRTKRAADARRLVWLALRFLGHSFPEMGALTGGFDHSTIICSLKKATDAQRAAAKEICGYQGVMPTTEAERREALFAANVERWRKLCAEDRRHVA